MNGPGPLGHPDPEQQAFWDVVRERHYRETGSWPADVDLVAGVKHLDDIRKADETLDAIVAGSDMDPSERDRILRDLAGKPVHGCCPTVEDADVTLRALLGGYRNAIHARKLPPMNIDAGRVAHLHAQHKRRQRHLRAFTWTLYALVVVAALVLCILTLASSTAAPGDWLWPLHQFVYTATT